MFGPLSPVRAGMNPRYAGHAERMDASALTKLYSIDGPFTTIYLDTTSQTEDAAEQLEIRWKNVVRELADRGIDEATVDALFLGLAFIE